MNIILCGQQACGKTTVGREFAIKYKYNFIDTDDLIANSNFAIREIYQTIGEEKFRQLEEKKIATINNISLTIIASGGGAILSTNNVKHFKSLGKLVYLLNNKVNYRNKIYDSVADHIIDTREKEIAEVVELVWQVTRLATYSS